MTMADRIVVMNGGRIEQMGVPAELYEHPATAFVASFLGISNLLEGTVSGADSVAVDGTSIRVASDVLAGRTGRVAIGIRPEKLRIGGGETNVLGGEIVESAYVGVATQYLVKTAVGEVTVYVQGAGSHKPGERVEVSFAPESTFVVSQEGGGND